MEGAKGFGPRLTFYFLVLQALLNAALCPMPALIGLMCMHNDVCASAKEPPAVDTQPQGCLSIPISAAGAGCMLQSPSDDPSVWEAGTEHP